MKIALPVFIEELQPFFVFAILKIILSKLQQVTLGRKGPPSQGNGKLTAEVRD